MRALLDSSGGQVSSIRTCAGFSQAVRGKVLHASHTGEVLLALLLRTEDIYEIPTKDISKHVSVCFCLSVCSVASEKDLVIALTDHPGAHAMR